MYWPVINYKDIDDIDFDNLADRTVCVSACPNDEDGVDIDDPGVCIDASSEVTCDNEYDGETFGEYDTERYFGKMCLPQAGTDVADDFRESFFEYLAGDNTMT